MPTAIFASMIMPVTAASALVFMVMVGVLMFVCNALFGVLRFFTDKSERVILPARS